MFVSGKTALDQLVDRAGRCSDLAWLAGLMEGEGSFFPGSPSSPNLPVMQVAMIDEDVVTRAAALLGVKTLRVGARREEWKATYVARVRGAPAVAWMMALRPHLGRRRRAQVDRALSSYAPRATRRLDGAGAVRALDQLERGRSVRAVAVDLGVSVWCIYDLRAGRTHKHLERRALPSGG